MPLMGPHAASMDDSALCSHSLCYYSRASAGAHWLGASASAAKQLDEQAVQDAGELAPRCDSCNVLLGYFTHVLLMTHVLGEVRVGVCYMRCRSPGRNDGGFGYGAHGASSMLRGVYDACHLIYMLISSGRMCTSNFVEFPLSYFCHPPSG